ncbi:MAG: UTP--glucose-1-phosphate uridylyltransferase [Polyangia bacterium]
MATVKPVRKAVLPVAGVGTRFLPVTKAVAKELLPIVDVPAIQINVEECVASGLRDLILVTSRGKDGLIDYFDRAAELEALLERKGKQTELAMIRRLTELAQISSVRQPETRGLGHAVLCARAAVGDEPFAVLLGDDLFEGNPPGTKQLLDVHAKYGKGVVGLVEVPPGQEHLYGIVAGESLGGGVFRLNRLVEKPEPGKAPSRLAIVGRYVLPPEIFPILANTKPGQGGEIQLTDALAALCASDGLYGVQMRGERFDAGDRTGYVLAVLRYALRRSDIGAAVRAGAEKLLRAT